MTNDQRSWLSYVLEIIVIIVGILGAFLLDSWNDARIDRNTEVEILKEIRTNLIGDFEDMNQNIANLGRVEKSAEILLAIIKNNASYHDSLGYHYFNLEIYPHFTTNQSGYSLLKSKGLDLISDNALRQSITKLYEYHFSYLLTWEEEIKYITQQVFERKKHHYRDHEPIDNESYPESAKNYWNYQRYVEGKIAMKMTNFSEFKKDTEMHSIIAEIRTKTKFLRPFHERAKRESELLIQQIEESINHIE